VSWVLQLDLVDNDKKDFAKLKDLVGEEEEDNTDYVPKVSAASLTERE